MEITLKACRINAGLTQVQLADAIGVTPLTISNWELGKTEPSLSCLRKISEVTQIPLDNISISSLSMNSNS